MSFSAADLAQLKSRGVPEAEAARQLSLFKNPPPHARLARPCKAGDGILSLSEAEQKEYEDLGATAMRQGRVTKFTPASGAATRMFQSLLAGEAGALQRWDAEKSRFSFEDWKAVSDKPKALIPFHRYSQGVRTAFDEHLREAAALGILNLHFTVSAGHLEAFENLLMDLSPVSNVAFSEQAPSTDTLAADEKGEPFRDAEGKLVFRPGGHGALLQNLNELQADLLLIKNIDNITHERLWPEQLRWKRILLGACLKQGSPGRPVRACGVVKNTGEPGGGPFWLEGDPTPQIVESAQVNLADPAQKSLFESSTHFNPVDIAANVKGHDLMKYRDENAVFISKKSKDGRPLQALELPGLWNGAMAKWHTVFVEVPLETFNPVKTVFDLLKPAHQPA